MNGTYIYSESIHTCWTFPHKLLNVSVSAVGATIWKQKVQDFTTHHVHSYDFWQMSQTNSQKNIPRAEEQSHRASERPWKIKLSFSCENNSPCFHLHWSQHTFNAQDSTAEEKAFWKSFEIWFTAWIQGKYSLVQWVQSGTLDFILPTMLKEEWSKTSP